jgi:kynurenine formamidase
MCVPGTAETVRAALAERERVPEPPLPRVSRRAALAAGAGALVAAAAPSSAAAGRRRGRRRERLVDLTHVYREDFPLFPGSPVTKRRTHVTVERDGFYGQVWELWEHTCTHMDVPAHFVVGGRSSEELLPEELVAPIVVIDISRRAAREPDTQVTPGDVLRFERRNGRVPKGAIVAMHSGWESRAGSEEAYRNGMRFPGFGEDAVRWLLDRRRIGGIGVDTLSLDNGSSSTFAAHKAILGADGLGIENLRNLTRIPARGATVYMGLIPWRDGSGGPARILASV